MTLVRPAHPGDFEAIRRLKAQVHELHVAAEPEIFRAQADPLSADFFGDHLARGDVYALEHEGLVAGYAFAAVAQIKDHPIFKDQKTFSIDDLCIAEDHRRQGLGRFFFRGLERIGSSLGCTSVELTVWDFNEPAREFYRSLALGPKTLRLRKPLES